MDKQDIIKMAREAGATPYTNRHYPDRPTHTFTVEQLERFATFIAAAEREACAKVCETTPWSADIDWWRTATKREVGEKSALECTAAIRARGQQ